MKHTCWFVAPDYLTAHLIIYASRHAHFRTMPARFSKHITAYLCLYLCLTPRRWCRDTRFRRDRSPPPDSSRRCGFYRPNRAADIRRQTFRIARRGHRYLCFARHMILTLISRYRHKTPVIAPARKNTLKYKGAGRV